MARKSTQDDDPMSPMTDDNLDAPEPMSPSLERPLEVGLPPHDPPSLSERHPLGVGDITMRVAHIEAHLRDLIARMLRCENS